MFLLETSVLDRLSGGLCDALTGRAGGQAMLEQVEQANLFLVPLDEVRGWWRYHHLFADLGRCRARLRCQHHRMVGCWRAHPGRSELPSPRSGPARAVLLGCLARVLRAFGGNDDGRGAGRSAAAAVVPGLVEQLTARELEILVLLAAGTPNPAIAEELVVSLDTVKKHVSHLLDKLGAANRTEAVTRARQLGLIP